MENLLLIFDFVMKSGQVRNLATRSTSTSESDVRESAAQVLDTFAKLQALSGYDPRTKHHWRVATDEVAIVEAYSSLPSIEKTEREIL